MHIRRGLQAIFIAKIRQKSPKPALQHPQHANQTPQRRRVVCTRVQGLFAHATTPGAPTIGVTQAKRERHKHNCTSGPPERVHAARRLPHPACMLAFNIAPPGPAFDEPNKKSKHRARLIRKSLQGVRPQLCAAFLVAALQARQGFSERLRPSLRCDCFEQAR